MRSFKLFAVLFAVFISVAFRVDAAGPARGSKNRNIPRVEEQKVQEKKPRLPGQTVNTDRSGIHEHVLAPPPAGDRIPAIRDVGVKSPHGIVAQHPEQKPISASVEDLKDVNWQTVSSRVRRAVQASYFWNGVRDIADASSPEDVGNDLVLDFWQRYVTAAPEHRKTFYRIGTVPLDEALSRYLSFLGWYRAIDHARRGGRADSLSDEQTTANLSDRNAVKNDVEFMLFAQQVSKGLHHAGARAVVGAIAEGRVTNKAIAKHTMMKVREVEYALRIMRRYGNHLSGPTTKPANTKPRAGKLRSFLCQANGFPVAA